MHTHDMVAINWSRDPTLSTDSGVGDAVRQYRVGFVAN
jgi:hypothetical protein